MLPKEHKIIFIFFSVKINILSHNKSNISCFFLHVFAPPVLCLGSKYGFLIKLKYWTDYINLKYLFVCLLAYLSPNPETFMENLHEAENVT